MTGGRFRQRLDSTIRKLEQRDLVFIDPGCGTSFLRASGGSCYAVGWHFVLILFLAPIK